MRPVTFLLLVAAASARAAGPPELWGFADLHVHPAAHLAFGSDAHGRYGILWGTPGLALQDAQSTLATDLPACYPGAHEGFDLDLIRKATHAQLLQSLDSLTGWSHAANGNPDYLSWPNALSLDHQQLHILMLRRAWEGGLRLMVATAVDNQFLSVLWSKIGFNLFGNTMPPPGSTYDYDSARRQLDFLELMASRNSSWMRVVTSAAEARQAIRENKLALVLGLEFDSLTADQIIDLVKNHKVRHVIPIHLANNSLGGTAISENLVNTSNQYLTGSFFKVTCDPTLQAQLGRPSILKPSGTILMPGAMLVTPVTDNVYNQLGYTGCQGGHKNTVGLTPEFSRLFDKLMQAGILVDIAHMSDLATKAAITLAEAHQYPLMVSHDDLRYPCPHDPKTECGSSERDLSRSDARRVAALGGVIGLGTSAGPGARHLFSASGNPVLARFTGAAHIWSSAVSYREPRAGQTIARLWVNVTPNDGLGRDARADLILKLKDGRRLEFANLNRGDPWESHTNHRVNLSVPPGIKLGDIAGITVEAQGNWTLAGVSLTANERELDPVGQWLKLYQEALAVMGGHGVAIGTDQNGFSVQIDYSSVPIDYPITAPARFGLSWGYPRPALPQFRLGSRIYDFQKDGLAHYGMLPDFMQALSQRTHMQPKQALDAIYHSAEDVVEMWEKAEAAGRTLTSRRADLPLQ